LFFRPFSIAGALAKGLVQALHILISTVFQWVSFAVAWTSRSKRASDSALAALPGLISLIAQGRLSNWCSARYTSPMPPAPSLVFNTY
jgi:hypothetical protein